MKKIGFISTRISGTDGVSLEIEKWASVLEAMGFKCFYFAGELDRPAERSLKCPLAHFKHPEIERINHAAFRKVIRPESLTLRILRAKNKIKSSLKRFIKQLNIDIIIVENALAIPVNLPLGLACTEYIAESGIPTIAHNHDFYWERKRFSVNCVWDYLNNSFPPRHPFVRHVVINSDGRSQLALRRAVSAVVIPNVMDYESSPSEPDSYSKTVKKDLGISPDEYFILQPTRIVQRKGIEHAVELIKRLENRKIKAKLVISHASGDEGGEYENRIREYSRFLNVNTIFVSGQIGERRGTAPDGKKIYSLSDVYPFADFITYPSAFEGFGNAFLEAVFFKKPVLINNYSIYANDIKPKGFDVVEIDDYLTETAVKKVEKLLKQPESRKEITEKNYALALKYFSYSVLRRKLSGIISDFFGEEYE